MRRTPLALTGLTLATALALAGCGTTDADDTPAASADAAASSAGTEPSTAAPTTDPTTTSSAPTGGARDGSASSAAPSEASSAAAAEPISEEHGPADVMFAQMMVPHHEQALEMSRIVLAEEGVPEDVQTLAQQIEAAQAPEITRMQDMLAAWGVTDAQHMDHSGHGGMEGMLTEEQLQNLRDAEGPEAARLFLEGMIEHHQGAVGMAKTQLDDGQNPQARALAEDVIAAQEEEIAQMEDMLAGL